MESEHISNEAKEKLQKQHEMLSPFKLKEVIEQKLRHIFQFVLVTSEVRKRL